MNPGIGLVYKRAYPHIISYMFLLRGPFTQLLLTSLPLLPILQIGLIIGYECILVFLTVLNIFLAPRTKKCYYIVIIIMRSIVLIFFMSICAKLVFNTNKDPVELNIQFVILGAFGLMVVFEYGLLFAGIIYGIIRLARSLLSRNKQDHSNGNVTEIRAKKQKKQRHSGIIKNLEFALNQKSERDAYPLQTTTKYFSSRRLGGNSALSKIEKEKKQSYQY